MKRVLRARVFRDFSSLHDPMLRALVLGALRELAPRVELPSELRTRNGRKAIAQRTRELLKRARGQR